MLKQTFLAVLMVIILSPDTKALPGDSQSRVVQILKHHAFFPSNNFRQEIGEQGPIRNFRALTDNRLLYLSAYYNVHIDNGQAIQYEQVAVVKKSDEIDCLSDLQMQTYYASYSLAKPFPELLAHCAQGSAVDFHIKDAKGLKSLELVYGVSSSINRDFRDSKRVREFKQYFYMRYDENLAQPVRKLIPGNPIPFVVFKGAKFSYIATPNSLMIVKPTFSFKEAYADWEKDEQLFKQIQSDQQKQKPFEL